ncbi:MAG: 30S ribosomal protein S2 [Candidatus Roizmanbacteria bacterium GW2011_GWA2_37_7]|uniref:Small ribosomal subunit protein uS2 n=1 Tax=Candidatus Roizmanbacteria bacterium GW2011_GWA2_37_7 TaxID=1618481 RepID=A0A0G0KAE3_9BACT|nr:MAG: 30S ribosomal protein S2 [Candidatus Roizmanbacteria bacterium GW2011_GWA2_37_7]
MTKQSSTKKVEVLFELGAHLGHTKGRLHPKARKNVYTIMNKTSIIDLTKTVDQIEKAKKYITESAKNGKSILVVGTKKTACLFVKKFCSTHSIPYISSKWLPGLLTNFKMIMKNVQKLKNLREQIKTGEIQSLVKHERTKISKEITKLERLYSGIELLNDRPHFVVIVDVRKEKNAVKETQEFHIPIVAIVDTNADPDTIDYPVVANDDDTEVVEYIMKDLLDEYVNNYKEPEPTKPTAV